ncbi:MAG: GatB/YqeY domain-containing protein [Acidobacteria bacterium]|nr:GatB/YqeY domain-containing protein [Acidobacteriota bacterium]
MTLTETVTAEIAVAMKARDATRLTALRMLKTALTNKSIEKGRGLDAAEDVQVVSSLVKQRREAIEQFTAGQRLDLAEKEAAEITILEAYLPPSLSTDELESLIAQAITDTGATGARDMGRVMKAVMTALAGKTVDGKRVNELVRARLAG